MNLLGFKDVIFDSFDEDNEFVYVHASVEKMDTCPHCGSKRIWVHDHRIQKIKDTHIHGKKCLIHLKKTRYDCKSCGCRFERELDFIAKGHTMTNRLVFAILNRLKGIRHITYKKLNFLSLLVRNFFKVVKQKVLIPSRQNINDRVFRTIKKRSLILKTSAISFEFVYTKNFREPSS